MLYFWGIALDRLILDVSLNLDHGHFDPYTANPRVLIPAIALVQHFCSHFSSYFGLYVSLPTLECTELAIAFEIGI